MFKICNLCNQNLSLENFTVNKATKDGYSNRCKNCYSTTRKKNYVSKEKKIVILNPTEKLCKSCNQLLSIENFDKSKIIKDGYENKCKPCRKMQKKQSVKDKQEKIALGQIVIKDKKCVVCKSIKSIENFSKDRSRGDGHDATCKFCKSINHQKYIQTDNGKEKSRVRNIKFKKLNPEKIKQHYLNNKEFYRQKSLRYRKTASGVNTTIKSSAKVRGINYNLSKSFISKFLNSNCHYCNNKLDTARFDRIDSNLGYNENNVVPCCSTCNYMKNNLSLDSFINHVNKILTFRDNKIYENRIPEIIYSGNPKRDYYLSPFGRYSWCQSTSKTRKIPFHLSYEEFIQFWQKPCSYCGSTIDTIGLDRYDNNQGYIVTNIKPCCFTCNSMKNDKTYEEFINHCQKIYNHRITND